MNVSEKIMVARKVANKEFSDARFTLKQQIDEYLDELRWGRACYAVYHPDPLGAKVANCRPYALLRQSA